VKKNKNKREVRGGGGGSNGYDREWKVAGRFLAPFASYPLNSLLDLLDREDVNSVV